MSFTHDTFAKGGRHFYGARLGILMLETQFPRITGEIGNANTWPFPVQFKVVRGASAERVVCRSAEGLLERFIDGAKELIADGADGITTSCGFLSIFQQEIADACDVPVATSSLLQAQMIQSLLPAEKRVGILTMSAGNLSEQHLKAASVPEGSPVVGLESSEEFYRVILNDEEEMDVAKAEQDLLAAADRLVGQHADVGAILLECTNMSPYSSAISGQTRLPVFDIVSFLNWFHSGLRPRNFGLSSRSGYGFTDF